MGLPAFALTLATTSKLDFQEFAPELMGSLGIISRELMSRMDKVMPHRSGTPAITIEKVRSA